MKTRAKIIRKVFSFVMMRAVFPISPFEFANNLASLLTSSMFYGFWFDANVCIGAPKRYSPSVCCDVHASTLFKLMIMPFIIKRMNASNVVRRINALPCDEVLRAFPFNAPCWIETLSHCRPNRAIEYEKCCWYYLNTWNLGDFIKLPTFKTFNLCVYLCEHGPCPCLYLTNVKCFQVVKKGHVVLNRLLGNSSEPLNWLLPINNDQLNLATLYDPLQYWQFTFDRQNIKHCPCCKKITKYFPWPNAVMWCLWSDGVCLLVRSIQD